jgi:chemotaxis protein MotA
LTAIYNEEGFFYHVIRDILVAHLHGNAAQVSVEIGRGSVPSDLQPSFAKLEEAMKNIPTDAAA